jgi:hypothetical protein
VTGSSSVAGSEVVSVSTDFIIFLKWQPSSLDLRRI